MKGIKELLLDESPKNQKKLAKLLSKDPVSASFLEAVKSEARSNRLSEAPYACNRFLFMLSRFRNRRWTHNPTDLYDP